MRCCIKSISIWDEIQIMWYEGWDLNWDDGYSSMHDVQHPAHYSIMSWIARRHSAFKVIMILSTVFWVPQVCAKESQCETCMHTPSAKFANVSNREPGGLHRELNSTLVSDVETWSVGQRDDMMTLSPYCHYIIT